jgi:hypothetical protein
LLVSHHHYHTHHHHSIIIIIIIIAIIAIPDPLTTRAPPRWSRTEAQPIVHETAMKCVGSGARAKRATEGEAQGTVPFNWNRINVLDTTATVGDGCSLGMTDTHLFFMLKPIDFFPHMTRCLQTTPTLSLLLNTYVRPIDALVVVVLVAK